MAGILRDDKKDANDPVADLPFWLEGKVKAFLGREAEHHAQIFLEESARIRHVTCGTLPCVTITSLNPDARMVKNVNFDMLRLMGSQEKSRRNVMGKVQLPY